jgi:hypothetical protein
MFGVGVLALALPLTALANIVVESLKGDVQASGAPVTAGQRLVAAVSVTTGPGAQAFLRFDDGMQIVLGENSLLRVIDFRFSSSGVTDRAVFELLRGGARVVTGNVALKNPKQFFFRTPQTQLTVERPADFSVALVNPAYITVNFGTVLSSNGWGTVPLNAGTTATVAGNAAAPAGISASALPSSASSMLGNLSLAQVSLPAGGTASGLGLGAVGGAAQTTTTWVIFGVIVAGAAVVIANQDDDAPAPAATPSHH